MLPAMHPFLRAVEDLGARVWAAQEKVEEAANVNDVLVATARPLQVHMNAGRMRAIHVDVGDLKKVFTGRSTFPADVLIPCQTDVHH